VPKTNEGLVRELTVGEVAARSGVPVSTLHFYEVKGLIYSRRSEGNQRRYARDVLRRVAVIKVAQNTGMPLAAIRHALKSLPRERTPTTDDWRSLSAAWRADLTDRISRLTRLRDQLDGCIGCGCLSLGVCPLRNPWDKLGRQGPGPRLLDPSQWSESGGKSKVTLKSKSNVKSKPKSKPGPKAQIEK